MQIKEISRETMVVLPVPVKGEYLFTIGEALTYIVNNDKYWLLHQMMIYNVSIRNAINNNGIRIVVDVLMGYVPDNANLKAEFDELVRKFGDTRLADFDIQVLPVTAELCFFGKRIENFDELMGYREIIRWRGDIYTSEYDVEGSKVHVAQIYEPYPCFDYHDRLTETRSYDNFIVRDHKITEDYCRKLEESDLGCNYCFVVESLPADFLPMLYRNGDDRFMYVATAKDNPQITPEELAKNNYGEKHETKH